MSDAPDTFLTLASASRYEPNKIKGSRFIACVAPAADEAAAAAFVDEVRAEFDDSRHVAYAWRLGPKGDVTRSNDDGEPSGSAGRPILLQLEGHEVTDVVAAVVRYFGGTKLGVGGLMRAYGGAAGQALDRAEIREVVMLQTIDVRHPYGDSGAVSGVLAAWNVEPADAEYGEDVCFRVRVPLSDADRFCRELKDATGARASTELAK